MLRLVNMGLACVAAIGAVGLYWLKHDTRRLDRQVQADVQRFERLETDIRMLRAEWAYLSRPERIEGFARELGLKPIDPGQIIGIDGLAKTPPLPARGRP